MIGVEQTRSAGLDELFASAKPQPERLAGPAVIGLPPLLSQTDLFTLDSATSSPGVRGHRLRAGLPPLVGRRRQAPLRACSPRQVDSLRQDRRSSSSSPPTRAFTKTFTRDADRRYRRKLPLPEDGDPAHRLETGHEQARRDRVCPERSLRYLPVERQRDRRLARHQPAAQRATLRGHDVPLSLRRAPRGRRPGLGAPQIRSCSFSTTEARATTRSRRASGASSATWGARARASSSASCRCRSTGAPRAWAASSRSFHRTRRASPSCSGSSTAGIVTGIDSPGDVLPSSARKGSADAAERLRAPGAGLHDGQLRALPQPARISERAKPAAHELSLVLAGARPHRRDLPVSPREVQPAHLPGAGAGPNRSRTSHRRSSTFPGPTRIPGPRTRIPSFTTML